MQIRHRVLYRTLPFNHWPLPSCHQHCRCRRCGCNVGNVGPCHEGSHAGPSSVTFRFVNVPVFRPSWTEFILYFARLTCFACLQIAEDIIAHGQAFTFTLEDSLGLSDQLLYRTDICLINCSQTFPPEKHSLDLLNGVGVASELTVCVIECTPDLEANRILSDQRIAALNHRLSAGGCGN